MVLKILKIQALKGLYPYPQLLACHNGRGQVSEDGRDGVQGLLSLRRANSQ
jgi:hypothetical protein